MILSVSDDVGPNLIGHRYDDSDEFIDKFKAEKYQTIFKQKKSEKQILIPMGCVQQNCVRR